MKKPAITEQFKLCHNVYLRVSFFKKMYPLSAILKDVFFLPFDYILNRRFIKTVRNITIALTHKCNINCEMCYFRKQLKDPADLPVGLFKRIIGSVKKSHPGVIFSGGEPFMHPDLLDMASYAKKSGLVVQIFTNGTLLNPDLIDKLVGMGLDYINFTLLGNEISHSEVAGVTNAYERFIENLRYFADHRKSTKVILNFTITPRAMKDIKHAVVLAKRYRLDGLRIQHYNFLLPGEFADQDKIIRRFFGTDANTHEIEGVAGEVFNMGGQLIALKKLLQREMLGIPVQWAPTLTEPEIQNWYSADSFKTRRKCFYPWRGILIDATGKIYPCSKIYLELGNTCNQETLAVWNSTTMNKFRSYLKSGLFPACSRCCKL